MNAIRLGIFSILFAALGCETSGTDSDPVEPVDAAIAVDSDTERSEWRVLTEADEHGLVLSTWGHFDDQVYFAGGQQDRTAIGVFDGTSLSWMDTPGDKLAWWIVGIGKGMYVVGEQGLGLRRAGDGPWTLWDTGVTQGTLFGVWGSAEDDLWIVGGDLQQAGPPILRRWHNDTWTDAALPDLGDASPEAFFKVWGTASDDVYVVGDDGVTLHFDGEDWQLLPAADTDALLTVHGRPDATWAVGGRVTGSVWRQGEDGWVDETPARLPGLAGLFVHADQTVLIGGFNGRVMERDATGTWSDGPRLTTEVLHSVWKTRGGAAFAAGGTLQRYPNTTEGVILYRPPAQ